MNKHIKLFEDYTSDYQENEEVSLGITWQYEFSNKDRDLIEESVIERISEMVKDGYTSGELLGEDPDFQGWWSVDIQDDNEDEEFRNEEVSRLIKNGNLQGYGPTFSWSANVWK